MGDTWESATHTHTHTHVCVRVRVRVCVRVFDRQMVAGQWPYLDVCRRMAYGGGDAPRTKML